MIRFIADIESDTDRFHFIIHIRGIRNDSIFLETYHGIDGCSNFLPKIPQNTLPNHNMSSKILRISVKLLYQYFGAN